MNLPFAVCTVCYCGLIFYVSSLSNPPVPDLGFFSWDKLLHAGAYAVLGWLAAMTLRRSSRGYWPAALFIIPAVFAALYGLSDELHQMLVKDRAFQWGDLVADTVGGTVIQGVFPIWERIRKVTKRNERNSA
jgi:VanZ family protein